VIVTSVGNVLVWAVWIAAAFACLASGIAVVSFSNAFFSALALIGNLGSLAVLYLLLSAEFVAAAQVLVYAGAVMVMFLFVIAYIGPRQESPWAGGPSWQAVGAVLAAAALFVEIVVVIGLKASGSLAHSAPIGTRFLDGQGGTTRTWWLNFGRCRFSGRLGCGRGGDAIAGRRADASFAGDLDILAPLARLHYPKRYGKPHDGSRLQIAQFALDGTG